MRCSEAAGLLALALVAGLAAAPARAQLSLGAAGGVVVPWDGNTGYSVSGEVSYRLAGRPWRFGGEFEYRHYESQLFGVEGVEIHSYQLRVFAHYLFELGPIRPYLGAGIQTSLNAIDDDAIEAVLSVPVDETGGALGATAIAGLELPLADLVSAFVEARVSVDAQLTEEDHYDDYYYYYYDDDDVDVEDLGGFSARGGLRIRF
jgi:hypothetical protein